MPKATKRERQRQNRDARREAMLAEEKRRRRFKAARNVGFLVLALAAVLVLVQLTKGDDSSSDSASTTKTTCTTKKPDAAPSSAQFDAAPPMTIDPAQTYGVVMSTSCGDIPITLDAAQSPQTANNFLFLADQGFYNGTTFHRIVPDFVDQGGDPTATSAGGPGYTLPDEPPANGYKAGDVAMARSTAGTSGSQFFLVVSDNGAKQLGGPPYQYNIVGHMSAAGLKVAQKINTFGTKSEKPSRAIYVFSVNAPSASGDTTSTTAAP